MDKNLKKTIMMLIAFAIVFFAVVMNISKVWNFVSGVVQMILPIFVGLLIAFVLNVPMRAFQRLYNWMFRKCKKKPSNKLISVLSLFSTLLCLVLVVSIVAVLAIPEIIESAKSIYALLKQKIPQLMSLLEKYNIDTSKIREWISAFDVNGLMSKITSGAGFVLVTVMNFATQTVSGIVSFVFACVIAIYVLLSKDTVKRHSKKLLYIAIKKEYADKVCDVARLTSKMFAQYLSGQCIEACILGSLITISFLIFRIPYAGIIGLMTGLSAFIPYVGAFIACFIGAFLILLVSPMQALLCIVISSVIQFIETQFIYPHVVGNSVGLSPLLTLLAALVGGNLMGFFGIVFFIPLTAVVFTLLKEYTDRRLAEKNIKIE